MGDIYIYICKYICIYGYIYICVYIYMYIDKISLFIYFFR